jgi:hypothetical protein
MRSILFHDVGQRLSNHREQPDVWLLDKLVNVGVDAGQTTKNRGFRSFR